MFTIIFIIKTFPQKFEETHGRDFIFNHNHFQSCFLGCWKWQVRAGNSFIAHYELKTNGCFCTKNSLDRDIMLLVHFMTFLCLLPCRMLMEKKERRSNSEGVYIIKRSSRLIHHTQRVLRRRKEIKFVTRICLCTLKARLRGIEKCFSTFGENAKWNSSWGDVQLSLRTLVLHTYYNIKEQYHGK